MGRTSAGRVRTPWALGPVPPPRKGGVVDSGSGVANKPTATPRFARTWGFVVFGHIKKIVSVGL